MIRLLSDLSQAEEIEKAAEFSEEIGKADPLIQNAIDALEDVMSELLLIAPDDIRDAAIAVLRAEGDLLRQLQSQTRMHNQVYKASDYASVDQSISRNMGKLYAAMRADLGETD